MGLHNIIDPISNSEDLIDSRDVIARIEQLKDELEEAHEGQGNDAPFDEWLEDMAADNSGTLQDAAEEFIALRKLADEAEPYAPDWTYGATLIRETYFEQYAEELLKDIGDLPQDLPGYIAIDWSKTADNLKVDYTEIDFDGEAYLIR